MHSNLQVIVMDGLGFRYSKSGLFSELVGRPVLGSAARRALLEIEVPPENPARPEHSDQNFYPAGVS
jgi:hypothetical protein